MTSKTYTTESHLTCIARLSASHSTSSSSGGGVGGVVMSPVWYCTFSPNGQYIASCHGTPDICIRIWKLVHKNQDDKDDNTNDNDNNNDTQWILAATLTGCHERTIRHVAFAPSNMILASASFDGTVGIWENLASHGHGSIGNGGNHSSDNWECTAQLEGHDNEVKCVAWNSSGTLLATCGRDKSVWVWECLLSMDASDNDMMMSAGGTGGDGEFECLAVLHGHNGDVKTVLFAPSNGQWGDGEEILLSASYDDTIKCWAEDGGDWYCAATLSAHTSTIWSIACTPGGARLVSASDDCSLAIWKCYTVSEKKRLISAGINMNMDGDTYNNNINNYSSSSDGLWKCVGKLDAAHKRVIYHVDCAPSRAGHGGIASSSSDTSIQIYREVNGSSSDAPLFHLDVSISKAHGEYDVNCIKWHPKDGKLLASAGDDGFIRIWSYTSSSTHS